MKKTPAPGDVIKTPAKDRARMKALFTRLTHARIAHDLAGQEAAAAHCNLFDYARGILPQLNDFVFSVKNDGTEISILRRLPEAALPVKTKELRRIVKEADTNFS